MTNRTFLVFIALALLAALAGLAVPGEAGDALLRWGLSAAQILGVLLLLYNGTIWRTLYFRIIQVCLAGAAIGALFKIMHWVGADALLLGSLGAIGLIYAAWFARKERKTLLDVLKLLWVLVAYPGSALLVTHWLPREVIYIAQALLWLAVIEFVRVGAKTTTLYEE